MYTCGYREVLGRSSRSSWQWQLLSCIPRQHKWHQNPRRSSRTRLSPPSASRRTEQKPHSFPFRGPMAAAQSSFSKPSISLARPSPNPPKNTCPIRAPSEGGTRNPHFQERPILSLFQQKPAAFRTLSGFIPPPWEQKGLDWRPEVTAERVGDTGEPSAPT